MITLTGLNGERFGLNPDLMVTVVATAEGQAVVVLVTGDRYLVSETVDEVAGKMLSYRIAVVNGPLPSANESRHLHVVQPQGEERQRRRL